MNQNTNCKIIKYFTSGAKVTARYIRRKITLGVFNALCFSSNHVIGQYIKTLILKTLLKKIGANSSFSECLYILYGQQISIGNRIILGTHCKIYDFSPVTIGDNLLASHGLTLISASHDPVTYENRSGPITIGNNVWIGINVTIVGPVTIGDNAVIGACSLVIRDVPSNAIVAGVPAKIIRYKDTQMVESQG